MCACLCSRRYDLAFDWLGVGYVLANDVFTSLVGVLMEKKMDAKELNSWGLMYAEPCPVHTPNPHVDAISHSHT